MMILSLIFLSSFMTYVLQLYKKLDAIKSSSMVTLLLSAIVLLLNQIVSLDTNTLLKAIFGASFVGMCSPQYFKLKSLFFMNLIFSGLFFFVLEKLPYPGGSLGFLAFVSVSLIFFLSHFLRFRYSR